MHMEPSNGCHLHLKQQLTIEQMKTEQQTGSVTCQLNPGDLMGITFEWVGDEIGANMGYAWEFIMPELSDAQIIERLKQNAGDEIGDINV